MPFVKGHKSKGGRPKGSNNFVTEFKNALKLAEKTKGISLINHLVKKAYDDSQIGIAVLKKILPDLSQSQIEDLTKGKNIVIINNTSKPSTEERTKDSPQRLPAEIHLQH